MVNFMYSLLEKILPKWWNFDPTGRAERNKESNFVWNLETPKKPNCHRSLRHKLGPFTLATKLFASPKRNSLLFKTPPTKHSAFLFLAKCFLILFVKTNLEHALNDAHCIKNHVAMSFCITKSNLKSLTGFLSIFLDGEKGSFYTLHSLISVFWIKIVKKERGHTKGEPLI